MAAASQPQRANHAELVARAQQCMPGAFDELYIHFHRRVYNICWRMTRNVAEAEDLTQDVFLQLFRKLGTFRGEAAFSTWLYRLAVNVVLMHLRKRDNGNNNVSLDEPIDRGNGETQEQEVETIDRHLMLSVERVALGKAVEGLSPGYRMIFVLHDVEGFEHNEIAEILGCTIGNSKSQLHKARAALLKLLNIEFDPLSILIDFDKFLSDDRNVDGEVPWPES